MLLIGQTWAHRYPWNRLHVHSYSLTLVGDIVGTGSGLGTTPHPIEYSIRFWYQMKTPTHSYTYVNDELTFSACQRSAK